nr:MAG TPA: hypothetical protein [Caudoviricetes sp.]
MHFCLPCLFENDNHSQNRPPQLKLIIILN